MPLGTKSLGRGSAAYVPDKSPVNESELSGRSFQPTRTYPGNTEFLVAMRLGDTPVLIPNTKVKT